MNRTPQNNDEYILGLDLGVQSVGWGKIPQKPEMIFKDNIRLGVRCFDGGSGGTEDDFIKGKDESPNKARREARSVRRNLHRRRRRLTKLFNILKEVGLLPKGDTNTPEKRQQYLNLLDKELMCEYLYDATHTEFQTIPYLLRARALDEQLSVNALGRVFYHLGQRRGFLSNKKTLKKSADKENEDEGKVKQGISDLQRAIEENQCRTLGEYFARLNTDQQRIRQRWTGRQMYLDEFERIWEVQSKYCPDLLTEKLKRKIHAAIFFQRPLKIQKFLIGKCELEKGMRNIPIADLVFQRFRYWQRLIDMKVLDQDGQMRPLTRGEQDILAEVLNNTDKLTFNDCRKFLKMTRPKVKKEEKDTFTAKIYSFNFEMDNDGENGIIGNRTRVKIVKKLQEHGITNPSDQEVDLLVREILQFENETALAKRLKKLFPFFDDSLCHQLSEMTLEPGYASLSRKAIEKILPKMLEERIPFATVRKEFYPQSSREPLDFLPPVKKAFPSLKNPAVLRTLSELRKVVNHLIRESGKPAIVRIELARDLKKSRKQRNEIRKQNEAQSKLREDALKKILKETGTEHPSPHEILKVLLAEECHWQCPYTGKQISVSALLGDSSQFDIEHIIPLSRSLDNSFINKTLCWSDENRHVKQNKTPFECYHNDPQRWHEIIERVKHFHGKDGQRKLALFLREEVSTDFTQRMLNDTRYISRLSADYLGLLYGGVIDLEGRRRVQVNSGGLTAWLRNAWELNSILNDGGDEKNRTDLRHHAIDALVIALSDARIVQKLSLAAQYAKEQYQRRQFVWSEITPPVDHFTSIVREAVDKINISHRRDLKVSGAIHKETNFSIPQHFINTKGESQLVRHIRKPLNSLTSGDVENIVDSHIRKLVQDKLQEIGGGPQKFNPSNLPMLQTKSGRLIPIKKVRVRVNVSVIPVGKMNSSDKENGGRTRYVAPGSNHHMEIIASLDKNGNETKWEGVVVTLYEAYRRRKNHESIVQRDHGPGKRFKFSLGLKEYFLMKDEEGKDKLYVVRVISQDQKGTKSISSKLHTDGRTSAEIHKTKGLIHNANTIKDKGIRKVHVDPLGNIRRAND